MEKSPDAFRTISEVADFLETPAHVLRFWESRFPQIRPVKRAGGRRYYRPGDVALLSGIKRLLHDEGMTIRGVQKILREQGIRYVAALAPAGADHGTEDDVESVLAAEFGPPAEPEEAEPAAAQTAQIISLERAIARHESSAPDTDDAPWPEADADDVPASSDTWPHDPQDVQEAPFVEVDAELPEPEVIGLPPSTEPAGAVEENIAAEEVAPSGPSESPDETTDEVPADDVVDAVTVAALLRRVPAGAAAGRQEELRALHRRLYDLRERLAQAARRRAR